jgi:hypothetical protein
VGFFATLTLIVIVSGAAISTVVLLWVGFATGSWVTFLAWKIVVASAWVLCIATVLTRVGFFRLQMLRAERERLAAENARVDPNAPPVPLPPQGDRPNGTGGNGGGPHSSLPQGERTEPA